MDFPLRVAPRAPRSAMLRSKSLRRDRILGRVVKNDSVVSILRVLTKPGGDVEKTGGVSTEVRTGFFRRLQRSCSQTIEMHNRKSFFAIRLGMRLTISGLSLKLEAFRLSLKMRASPTRVDSLGTLESGRNEGSCRPVRLHHIELTDTVHDWLPWKLVCHARS